MPGLIHQRGLATLLEKMPKLRVRGFGEALRALDDTLSAIGFRPGVIPDAFKISMGTDGLFYVRCYEVDASKGPSLNDDRLRKYASLWHDLDCTDGLVLFELVIADRFGNVVHTYDQSDLMEVRVADLLERAAERASDKDSSDCPTNVAFRKLITAMDRA